MYFRQMPYHATGALSYLLADIAAREAVVIDPQPAQSDLILALLMERKLQLRYVLLTHTHRRDSGCGPLCEYTGAERVCGGEAATSSCIGTVGHGDDLAFGDEVIHVLGTPGHTADAVSYLWHDRLFCGDALHIRGCPASEDDTDPGQLFDSVTRRIFQLPDETLIFPAHDFQGRTVTTVAEERQHNPAFCGQTRDAFIASAQDLGNHHRWERFHG